MAKSILSVNHLSYRSKDSNVQFKDICLSFGDKKVGVVGRNGIGKTTLLKLLNGMLEPDSGSVLASGDIYLLPQLSQQLPEQLTVAEAVGVDEILGALHRIEQGSTDQFDYDCVGDNWDIESRIVEAFAKLSLPSIEMSSCFHHLSGGQKTKLLLSRSLIFNHDLLLLDEPSNNLDSQGREVLCQFMRDSDKAMVIVSHDRKLLNHCDQILEITAKRISSYGGNYDYYRQQKKIELEAISNAITNAQSTLTKTKKTIQSRFEKHSRAVAKGNKSKTAQIKAKGSYDKIAIKSQKGRSERTNKRIRTQAERKLNTVNAKLDEVNSKLEFNRSIKVKPAASLVHCHDRVVLRIQDLSFTYPKSRQVLLEGINLELRGGDRVAVCGRNGAGKSTLLKLILGELKHNTGKLEYFARHTAYIDQNVSILENNLSLLENYLKLNPLATIHEAYSMLASFNIRNTQAEKLVCELSGGEKTRAGLAVTLGSKQPPDLIILDEPTNYLDVDSVEKIEEILSQYQGAILAVSHDELFLERIRIDRFIQLNLNEMS